MFYFPLGQVSVRMRHLHRHLRIHRSMMADQGWNSTIRGENQRQARVRIAVIGAQTSEHRFRLKNPVPGVAHRDSPAQQTRNAVKQPGRIGSRIFWRTGNQTTLERLPGLRQSCSFACGRGSRSRNPKRWCEYSTADFSDERCFWHRPAEISRSEAAPRMKPRSAKH